MISSYLCSTIIHKQGVRDSISSLVALLSGKQENELDIRSFTTHCMPDYTEAENQSGKGYSIE